MKRTRLILMAALMGFALAGCDAVTEESTQRYILPKDLADKGCKIYNMQGANANTLDVVYCPHADVTSRTKMGKAPAINATIINEDTDYGY